jgi:hypothetical protein
VKQFVWIPLVLISLTMLSSISFAHPVDECLQAAYLKLGPASLELELDLTPGERVAPQLLKLIDQNRDGLMDQPEVQHYVLRVLEDLRLNVDGITRSLTLEPVVPPPTDVFLAGGGTIKLLARTDLEIQTGSHTLEFRNAHAPVKSGYLANVFVQSAEVKILEQQRDTNQQNFRVNYSLEPRAPQFDWRWLIPAILAATSLIAWWLTRTKRRHSEGPAQISQL